MKQPIIQKEENIDKLEAQIAETQNSFDAQMKEIVSNHKNKMELFKQKTIDKLYTDEFKLFQKASDGYKASREKLICDASEQVKIITNYYVMDLASLCFSLESIAFIKSKVCIFAETEGKFDKTEPSPLVNPFKDIDARKRGRKKKVNTNENILTTQDIAHYTKNIAVYLDYRLEEVARLTEYLFKDWYGGGDFLSIAKAAAKFPDSG